MNDIFSINFSTLNREALLHDLCRRVFSEGQFGYLVTPNLDHLVKLRAVDEFFNAYNRADYVITDGWPVALLTALAKSKPGTLFPGSDLVPSLFAMLNSLGKPVKIYLLGAPLGVNEIAASVIASRWPYLIVSGHSCPPIGFLADIDLCRAIVSDINQSSADIIVCALGAPTQELFCLRYAQDINHGLGFCVGATTEFIAGTVKRAPILFRALRLEWLYRWVSSPYRLTRRYLRCIFYLPLLFCTALKARIFNA